MARYANWRNTIPYTTDASVVALARGVAGNAAAVEAIPCAASEGPAIGVMSQVLIVGGPKERSGPARVLVVSDEDVQTQVGSIEEEFALCLGDGEALAGVARVFAAHGVSTRRACCVESALEALAAGGVRAIIYHGASMGEGLRPLARIRDRFPRVARVLVADDPSPDLLVDAVNHFGVQHVVATTGDEELLESLAEKLARGEA